MSEPTFDPRYEWTEHYVFGREEPIARTKRCLHVAESVVPVESGGEIVAALCLTCDAQLPPTVETTHAVPVTYFRP